VPDRGSGTRGGGGDRIDAWLYRLVQFALEEAVAARTLDEVLSAEAVLDAELRTYVRGRIASTGIEVMAGVKDVILPGEIRVRRNAPRRYDRVDFDEFIREYPDTTRLLVDQEGVGICAPAGALYPLSPF
jgi:regulator of protease activity HflC (stomatin/prohibitin superfamily)